tara:strand:+ start:1285 stop:1467 length:183 start_codon:yes stop_codon:yes gene_type:complete
MKKAIFDVATGELTVIDMTAEEVAEITAQQEAYVPPAPAPTKEELMAQLAALSSKIQALE